MAKSQLTAFFWGTFYVLSARGSDAEGQRQSADIISYADVMHWMLSLIFVLALFGFLIWLLRKSGNLAPENKNQLAILSGLSLGMREKLVLVKVGEKQLLLGVTPGRVEKLLELEGDSRLFQHQTENSVHGLFAKKLQQVLQNKVDV